jgi:glycosyltransferase involved in cell wall biosynthesis
MKKKINFIYETKKWSIYDDGYNIKRYYNNIILSKYPLILPFQIKKIHFGSINLLFKFKLLLPIIKKLNIKIVCSWFHIDDSGKNFKNYSNIYKYVDVWHLTNTEIKKSLINFKIDEDKINIVKLGFDNHIFNIFDIKKKSEYKKKNIISDRLVIGSFVKDSPGFGNSCEPKSIKRPDLLIDIIKKINKIKKVFILLSGPSRGFVLKNLKKNQIDYLYIGNVPKKELALAMNVIDINLISSLREGGPKSAIESSACGKYILSTRVGMVPEIISKYKNGFLFNDINDFDIDLFLRDFESFKGINTQDFIDEYSWKSIAKNYEEKLYS